MLSNFVKIIMNSDPSDGYVELNLQENTYEIFKDPIKGEIRTDRRLVLLKNWNSLLDVWDDLGKTTPFYVYFEDDRSKKYKAISILPMRDYVLIDMKEVKTDG